MVVLGFAIIFGTVRMSMQRTISENIQNIVADYERMAALNVANSGVYVALQTVSEDNAWRDGFSNVAFAGGHTMWRFRTEVWTRR